MVLGWWTGGGGGSNSLKTDNRCRWMSRDAVLSALHRSDRIPGKQEREMERERERDIVIIR